MSRIYWVYNQYGKAIVRYRIRTSITKEAKNIRYRASLHLYHLYSVSNSVIKITPVFINTSTRSLTIRPHRTTLYYQGWQQSVCRDDPGVGLHLIGNICTLVYMVIPFPFCFSDVKCDLDAVVFTQIWTGLKVKKNPCLNLHENGAIFRTDQVCH